MITMASIMRICQQTKTGTVLRNCKAKSIEEAIEAKKRFPNISKLSQQKISELALSCRLVRLQENRLIPLQKPQNLYLMVSLV